MAADHDAVMEDVLKYGYVFALYQAAVDCQLKLTGFLRSFCLEIVKCCYCLVDVVSRRPVKFQVHHLAVFKIGIGKVYQASADLVIRARYQFRKLDGILDHAFLYIAVRYDALVVPGRHVNSRGVDADLAYALACIVLVLVPVDQGGIVLPVRGEAIRVVQPLKHDGLHALDLRGVKGKGQVNRPVNVMVYTVKVTKYGLASVRGADTVFAYRDDSRRSNLLPVNHNGLPGIRVHQLPADHVALSGYKVCKGYRINNILLSVIRDPVPISVGLAEHLADTVNQGAEDAPDMVAGGLVNRCGMDFRIMDRLPVIMDVMVYSDGNVVMSQVLKGDNGLTGKGGTVKGKGELYRPVHAVLFLIKLRCYLLTVFRGNGPVGIDSDFRVLRDSLPVYGKVGTARLVFQDTVYSISHSGDEVLQFHGIHKRRLRADGAYRILGSPVFCGCPNLRIVHTLVLVGQVAVRVYLNALMEQVFKRDDSLPFQDAGIKGKRQINRPVNRLVAILRIRHALRVGGEACYPCLSFRIKGHGAFRSNFLTIHKDRFAGFLVHQGPVDRILPADNNVAQLDGINQCFCFTGCSDMVTGLPVCRCRTDFREVDALVDVPDILVLIQLVEAPVFRYQVQSLVGDNRLPGKPGGVKLERHVLRPVHRVLPYGEFFGLCFREDLPGGLLYQLPLDDVVLVRGKVPVTHRVNKRVVLVLYAYLVFHCLVGKCCPELRDVNGLGGVPRLLMLRGLDPLPVEVLEGHKGLPFQAGRIKAEGDVHSPVLCLRCEGGFRLRNGYGRIILVYKFPFQGIGITGGQVRVRYRIHHGGGVRQGDFLGIHVGILRRRPQCHVRVLPYLRVKAHVLPVGVNHHAKD